MPPRMMTRSAGRSTAAPRGGGTGRRVGRGARRTRELVKRNNEINGELDGQGNDRGVEANEGGVPDFSTIIAQVEPTSHPLSSSRQPRNVIVNNDQRACIYKEFLACNPKEYDGKGGSIVYTRWIEKMESVQDMSGCGDNQKIHEKVATMEPATIQKAMQKAGTLKDEAIRNGSLKKNTEKRGNGGEPSRDRNVKDDNKRSST
nr:reverse transcriptase domain-containing protein [Tanacetum cinerariifolium]